MVENKIQTSGEKTNGRTNIFQRKTLGMFLMTDSRLRFYVNYEIEENFRKIEANMTGLGGGILFCF